MDASSQACADWVPGSIVLTPVSPSRSIAQVSVIPPGVSAVQQRGGAAATGRAVPNGVKLSLHRCKIACVARPGQQVVAGDRLADRIGVGVLTKVFPPELVDRV